MKIGVKERIPFCKKYYIWFAYILGVAATIENLDGTIWLKSSFYGKESYEFLSLMPWSVYWLVMLFFGAISGVIGWYLWGWWYKVRIKWSGVKNPDPFESRLIYAFSSFILKTGVVNKFRA